MLSSTAEAGRPLSSLTPLPSLPTSGSSSTLIPCWKPSSGACSVDSQAGTAGGGHWVMWTGCPKPASVDRAPSQMGPDTGLYLVSTHPGPQLNGAPTEGTESEHPGYLRGQEGRPLPESRQHNSSADSKPQRLPSQPLLLG